MSTEVTMKDFWKGTVDELKKYGLFGQTVTFAVFGVSFLVLFVVCMEVALACTALTFFLMTVFNCHHAAAKSAIDLQKELISDYKDRTVLLAAEIRNLKQELEAAQSRLKKNGHTATEPTVEAPQGQGQEKVRRRFALKRKPKTEETKNENQN